MILLCLLQGKLREDRKKRLDAIGFVWRPKERDFALAIKSPLRERVLVEPINLFQLANDDRELYMRDFLPPDPAIRRKSAGEINKKA